MTAHVKPVEPYRPPPCAGCVHRSRLWGMAFCKLGRWYGQDFEATCTENRLARPPAEAEPCRPA